jgi:hypothetical protein
LLQFLFDVLKNFFFIFFSFYVFLLKDFGWNGCNKHCLFMMCHIVKISHHKNWKKSKFILHFKTKHFKALIKKDLKESQKYINTAFLYFTSFTFESGIITVIIVIWDTKSVITFYFCEKTLPGRFVHRLLWQFYVHRLISTISGIASLFLKLFFFFLPFFETFKCKFFPLSCRESERWG